MIVSAIVHFFYFCIDDRKNPNYSPKIPTEYLQPDKPASRRTCPLGASRRPEEAEREVADQQVGTPSPRGRVLREAFYLSQNGCLTSPASLLYFPYNKIELC